ncbi:MAG: RDD family protein [Kineosporiaceae bacterium]
MSDQGRLPEGVSELVLPEDLVTGEAVVLDVRPASFATRALAFLLDLLVLVVLGFVIGWLTVTLTGSLDVAADRALQLTLSVGLLVLVPASWETLSRGRSPGKVAAGLRVVRDDGGPIRWRQALMRWLVAVPEIFLTGGSAALICSLANPRGKRLGDLLAGTFVVRERTSSAPLPPPPMPPELAAWAVGADIGRLPDSLAVASRQLLGRAHRLHPASRIRLGTELAQQVATYVAPSPPGVVQPERFLAAVLAERHRRALARLTLLEQRRGERARRRSEADVLSPASTRLI